jgi:hypothetical protein
VGEVDAAAKKGEEDAKALSEAEDELSMSGIII